MTNCETISKIYYSDKRNFEQKFAEFVSSYFKNKKSVAVITDFDYTITGRFDYKTGKEYKSSYYLYDEDIIGGDQKRFTDRQTLLADKYSKYEFSTSYDLETRKEKMKEWYSKTLSLYFNEKFTKESIDKMVKLKMHNLIFRKYTKEYIELLVSLGITIIIESGGIGQFIEGILKTIIPKFDEYIKNKNIILVSNFFKFDKNKGCVGLEGEVIYCFNKADFLGSVVNKELPELKHVLVLGDHLGDAESIKKINVSKDNVIGFGFLNLTRDILIDEGKREYMMKKIEENKKVFDMTLVGDSDYSQIIELLKIMQTQK